MKTTRVINFTALRGTVDVCSDCAPYQSSDRVCSSYCFSSNPLIIAFAVSLVILSSLLVCAFLLSRIIVFTAPFVALCFCFCYWLFALRYSFIPHALSKFSPTLTPPHHQFPISIGFVLCSPLCSHHFLFHLSRQLCLPSRRSRPSCRHSFFLHSRFVQSFERSLVTPRSSYQSAFFAAPSQHSGRHCFVLSHTHPSHLLSFRILSSVFSHRASSFLVLFHREFLLFERSPWVTHPLPTRLVHRRRTSEETLPAWSCQTEKSLQYSSRCFPATCFAVFVVYCLPCDGR